MVEIINTDCIKYLHTTPLRFDLVVADPPCNSGGMVRGDRTARTKNKYLTSDSGNQNKLVEFEGDTRDQRGFIAWCYMWMTEIHNKMNEGALFLCFVDWRQLPALTDAVQAAGFVWRGIIPWHKPNSRPQPNRYSNSCEFIVWATKGGRDIDTKGALYADGFFEFQPPQNRIHVTEKPVLLYRHLFQIVKPGQIVLDPFLGSASSAEAAIIEGLHFVGCEISPEIYALAKNRVEQAQKQTTILQEIQNNQLQMFSHADKL